MKKIFTLLSIVVFTVIFLSFLFVKTTLLDRVVKDILVRVIQARGYNVKIGELSKELGIKNSNLRLKNVAIYSQDQSSILIGELLANFNGISVLRDLKSEITFDRVLLMSKNNSSPRLEADFKINMNYLKEAKKYYGTLKLTKIISKSLKINIKEKEYQNLLENNICDFDFTESNKILNTKCNIYLNKDSFLRYEFLAKISNSYFLKKIEGNISGKNFPLIAQSKFSFLFPYSKAWNEITKIIRSGNIIEGKLNFNFDELFFSQKKPLITAENLNGKVLLQDIKIDYDPDFPPIENLKADLEINGKELKFFVRKASLLKTQIYNSVVNIDWQKSSDLEIGIKGYASGSVEDLVAGFILPKYLKTLDLNPSEVKGVAESEFDITIFTATGKKDNYLVKSNMSDVYCNLLKNEVTLSNTNLVGWFTGDKVILDGKGNVNNMNSKLDYVIEVDKKEPTFDLKVSTLINNKSKLSKFIKITDGEAVMDLHYQHNDEASEFKLTSNLENLGFSIENTPIVKKRGRRAVLNLSSRVKNTKNSALIPEIFNLKLEGEGGLQVEGVIDNKEDQFKLDLPIFKLNSNNFTLNMSSDKKHLNLDIEGESIDLSNLSLMDALGNIEAKFLAKNVKANVAKVHLADNVLLQNFSLDLQCTETKCTTGLIRASLEGKPVTLELVPMSNYNRWLIYTTDAGAIMKGLGISSAVTSGELLLTVDISNNDRNIQGDLSILKFTTKNRPFFTKLVSFLSIPGIINFITQNNKINFETLNLKFHYHNNNIIIDEGFVEGIFMDFSVKGIVDLNKRIYKISGRVYPDLYGINKVIKLTSIFNWFSKRRGVIAAPYQITDTF